MKFLHTADWHAGKTLRGRGRLEEMERVLAEMLDIARQERVDCVLVAGDVYDSYAPPADAERLVYDFFAELVGAGMCAVVIGGNHDHPHRLAAMARLLDPLRIFVRGQAEAGPGSVIEFERRGERAVVAALPWVPERRLAGIAELRNGGSCAYARRLGAMCEGLAGNFRRGTVNVFAAHLHVEGGVVSGSERANHVRLSYALDRRALPKQANYIALGHLHRPQEIDCGTACAYAGSPLQLDFGEREQDKRVIVVDARVGGETRVEMVGLRSGRRLRDLNVGLAEVDGLKGMAGDDFLRVTVWTEHPQPDLAVRIRRLLPDAVEVRQDFPKREIPRVERAGADPAELFAAYYRGRQGGEIPEALLALFQELYEEVGHAADQA